VGQARGSNGEKLHHWQSRGPEIAGMGDFLEKIDEREK
jgi:hypothetical protein